MDLIPIAIFWSLAAFCLVKGYKALILLFFGSLPFGSFAVLPPGVLGGLTLVPSIVVAIIIVFVSLLNSSGVSFILQCLRPKGFLFLALFWLVAVITTIFMPRIFAGEVDVIVMRGILTQAQPLQPSTQNFSQLAILSVGFASAFAFARILQDPKLRAFALKAMCLSASFMIFTGLLDFANGFLPLDPILQPFRTASYALLIDVEVLGAKRVVGLMPEASSFGSMCLGMLMTLYFYRDAFTEGVFRGRLVPALVIGLSVFVYLSTSSTAYVGFVLFVAVATARWMLRFFTLPKSDIRRKTLRGDLVTIFAGISFFAFALLVYPNLLDPIVAMFDRMVLQKTESQSFDERNFWTLTSLQAWFDSYLMGVGVGGTRASNSFVAVFSSVGLVGGFFYYANTIQHLFFRKAQPQDQTGSEILRGNRWKYLPSFLMGLAAGTSVGLSPLTGFGYGLALAISSRSSVLK